MYRPTSTRTCPISASFASLKPLVLAFAVASLGFFQAGLASAEIDRRGGGEHELQALRGVPAIGVDTAGVFLLRNASTSDVGWAFAGFRDALQALNVDFFVDHYLEMKVGGALEDNRRETEPSTGSASALLAVYVKNHAYERILTDSDEQILTGILAQVFYWGHNRAKLRGQRF